MCRRFNSVPDHFRSAVNPSNAVSCVLLFCLGVLVGSLAKRAEKGPGTTDPGAPPWLPTMRTGQASGNCLSSHSHTHLGERALSVRTQMTRKREARVGAKLRVHRAALTNVTALLFLLGGCAWEPEPVPLRPQVPLRAFFDSSAVGLSNNASDRSVIAALTASQRARAPIQYYLHHVFSDPEAKARDYLDNGLRIRDNPPLKLKPPIDWGANPKSDNNWLFQKNAMYVISPFVQAHARTGEATYLTTAKVMVLDWIEYNLERDKPNPFKWYDMATGLRAVQLAYVLDAELRADAPDTTGLRRLVRALMAHARELGNPRKLATGNHAYFQLVGLAAICKTLPDLRVCSEYVSYANRAMNEVIVRQFSREGIQREHAPEYHYSSLDWASRILQTGWFDISAEARVRLRRAYENQAWLRHPDGTVAMIGDSERGIPDKSQFLDVMGGRSPVAEFGRLFGRSGYAILRSAWYERPTEQHSYLIFWAGEEQPGEFGKHEYGHAHSDDFTFEWSEMGIPVVIDSGKYTYSKGRWSSYFLSTRAHNTVEVDGQDIPVEPPKDRPNDVEYVPTIVSASSGAPLQHVEARVTHFKTALEHRRLLVLRPGQWLAVVDLISAPETHDATQWLHFHEDWIIEEVDGVLRGSHPRAALQIRTLGRTPVRTQNIRGAETPRIQGWVSPAYMVRVPNAAVGSTAVGREIEFVTLISWGKDSTGSFVAHKREVTDDAITVCWSRDGGYDGFRFITGQKPMPCDQSDK